MEHNDPWQLYWPETDQERAAYTKALSDLEAAWELAKKLPTEDEARRYMESIMKLHKAAGAYDSEGFQELERRIHKRKTEW